MAVTLLVLVAIAADSWTFGLPMPAVPPFVALPDAVPPSAAVLELPLGNVGGDIAAVYRSIAPRPSGREWLQRLRAAALP